MTHKSLGRIIICQRIAIFNSQRYNTHIHNDLLTTINSFSTANGTHRERNFRSELIDVVLFRGKKSVVFFLGQPMYARIFIHSFIHVYLFLVLALFGSA
jgi:hypothetical protein